MARIVLVDDDALMVDVLSAALESGGHVVTAAADGDEGVRLIDRERPDLVVLDCGLSGVSELQILDGIQRGLIGTNVPALILSVRKWPAHRRMMQAFGARAVLTKPITTDALLNAVNIALT